MIVRQGHADTLIQPDTVLGFIVLRFSHGVLIPFLLVVLKTFR